MIFPKKKKNYCKKLRYVIKYKWGIHLTSTDVFSFKNLSEEIQMFFYLKSNLNITINSRIITINKDFSLLVIIILLSIQPNFDELKEKHH